MSESNAEKYRAYLDQQIRALGSFDYDQDAILWHYTDGKGLIGMVESGMFYSTQVSCVNDSSEVRYAQRLFRAALTDSFVVGLSTKTVRSTTLTLGVGTRMA